ncbi:hypothetical protein D3C87_1091120 [compost metagenome]
MEITMTLLPHGWLDISISTSEGKTIEIPVSFLTNAIYEIANKTSSLDKDISDVIITMQTEPGEYRFKITKISNLLCKFQVYEMGDNFSSEAIEEGEFLISEQIQIIRLLRLIFRELTKMRDLGLEEFKERWNSDFPINAYKKIRTTIDNLKQF